MESIERNHEPVPFVFPARAQRQPSLYPPLGIGCLVSALKQHGIPSRVVDRTFDDTLAQLDAIRSWPKCGIFCVSSLNEVVKE